MAQNPIEGESLDGHKKERRWKMEGLYDVRKFLDRAKNLDFTELLREVQSSGYAAQRATTGRGSTEARRMGAVEFSKVLGGLAFFLQFRSKPDGLRAEELALFRPIFENLVQKGQLPPSVLDSF
jgi:hypothetical protein